MIQRRLRVARFVGFHLREYGAAFLILRRQPVEVVVQVGFHLALRLGQKTKVPAISQRARDCAKAKRPAIPERIEQALAPTQFVDAALAPGQVVGLLARRLFQRRLNLRIARGQGLTLIKRLGADFADMVDAHQPGDGLLLRRRQFRIGRRRGRIGAPRDGGGEHRAQAGIEQGDEFIQAGSGHDESFAEDNSTNCKPPTGRTQHKTPPLRPLLPYNRAMKLRIVAVGNRLPEWVYAGFAEYARRFPPELPLTLTEVRAEKRAPGLEPAVLMKREGERLLASLAGRETVIALDERGEQISTRQLAEHLQRWREASADATFLIGGADGLDAAVKTRAATQLALSRLTLPHGLARVLLAEQLYRAYSLLQGHPYHRE